MHNRVGFNRLSRKAAHRRAMTRNMVTSLFRYERITTTKAKAIEIRKTAEKMITRAKEDSVHNRRIINKDIKDAEVLNKLFTEIGPSQKDRPGGYTRILKTGLRKGDAAEMVILELVQDEVEAKKSSKKKAKKETPAKKETKEQKVEEIVEDQAEEKVSEEVPDQAVEETVDETVDEASDKAEDETPEEAAESSEEPK